MKRRYFLGGYAASVAWALPALGDSNAASLQLLVAGPSGEQTDRWATAWALSLSSGFPGAPNILTEPVGGLDGVTGGNRLEALVVPDGKTAALLPGAALVAWLTGDTRVHFDPTRWAPVLGGSQSGVLVVRLAGKQANLKSLQGFGGLRFAADNPESNDLAALIALERMGVQNTPVFGLRGTEAKTKAFAVGDVDAVFLCGEGVPEDVAPLSANGGVPVFTIGKISNGVLGADPLFSGVPEAGAFAPASPWLQAAYQAAAAAARLDYFMVLPRLSSPAAVADWRQAAAAAAIGDAALQSAASASGVGLLASADAIAELSALNISLADQAGLQSFLAQRFGWHPG